MCPFKDFIQIVFTLPCCTKMLTAHELPNPLVAINNLNTSHRMRLNRFYRFGISRLTCNTVHILHSLRNKLLKVSWIDI